MIVNTASISTSSSETTTSNNMDSATITVEDTDNFTPVPNPPTVKPTPNNPISTTIVGRGVTYSSDSVGVRLSCSGPCGGTARLLTARSVKVGGRKVKKGAVLAAGRYEFSGSGSSRVWLKVNGRGRRVLNSRKAGRRALVRLSSGSKKSIRIRR